MYTDDFKLIDNLGNVRTEKHLLGHIQSIFSEIKSKEDIVYPWKVVSANAKDVLVIDENTSLEDWRDYNKYCSMLL